MKRKNQIAACLFCLFALTVLALSVLSNASAKLRVEEIRAIPQEPTIDVVTRERDLLKTTSNWPKSFTVENISEQEVSGFTLSIVAANDDDGPGRFVSWGTNPKYAKQSPLLKPKNKVEVVIPDEVVQTFLLNGKPFLYVQLMEVWVNKDASIKYAFGAKYRQDPNNPKHYIVVETSKGEKRNWHHVVPHIRHSVPPHFPLPCCISHYHAVLEKLTILWR